jgi:hypothetical protein
MPTGVYPMNPIQHPHCDHRGVDWWRKSQRCNHPDKKYLYCKRNLDNVVCPLSHSTVSGQPPAPGHIDPQWLSEQIRDNGATIIGLRGTGYEGDWLTIEICGAVFDLEIDEIRMVHAIPRQK